MNVSKLAIVIAVASGCCAAAKAETMTRTATPSAYEYGNYDYYNTAATQPAAPRTRSGTGRSSGDSGQQRLQRFIELQRRVELQQLRAELRLRQLVQLRQFVRLRFYGCGCNTCCDCNGCCHEKLGALVLLLPDVAPAVLLVRQLPVDLPRRDDSPLVRQLLRTEVQ